MSFAVRGFPQPGFPRETRVSALLLVSPHFAFSAGTLCLLVKPGFPTTASHKDAQKALKEARAKI
jgi:hypothetical protein